MSRRFEEFVQHGTFLRNWSATTVRTYKQGLRTLAVEQPSKSDLDAWVIGLRQKDLTPGGCNMYIRTVNSYLTWLHEEGHAPARLRVKLLRAPLRQHRLLTLSEIKLLMRVTPRRATEHRTKTLILLLLDTGVRISEALSIERSRVRLEDMLLVVWGKGAKERTVPFSLEMRPVLFRWLTKAPSSPLLFPTSTGGRLTYRNTFREIRALCERAGVTSKVHPHLFRHQFAANYIKQGGDVYRLSRLLGHTPSPRPKPICDHLVWRT